MDITDEMLLGLLLLLSGIWIEVLAGLLISISSIFLFQAGMGLTLGGASAGVGMGLGIIVTSLHFAYKYRKINET